MTDRAKILETIIRARKTEKVICDVSQRKEVPGDIETRNKALVLDALKIAGWAPFHYAKGKDICEPWRAYALWSEELTHLTHFLTHDLKLKNKLPQLTAAASALVIVTWIPEARQASSGSHEKLNAVNEEHLAATSAMVQNFLLILTAHDMGNYWSSGGDLGSPAAFDYLGIPNNERLLAAVFIEYKEMMEPQYGEKGRIPGKLRDKRSTGWIKEVTLL